MKKLNKLKRIVCGLLAGITVFGATQTTAFAANPTVSSVGSTAAYTATSHYTDVPQGAYYAKAVEWARGKGITSDQTNKFCPKDNIKRGDYVLMLYRLEGSPAKPLHDEATEQIVAEFGDVSTSAYYYNAVCWGVRCDVIGGCSDGKFHPTDSITNKEAIQFLYAAAKSNKVYKIKAIATTAGKLTKTWKTSDWYYAACEWANNKGYLASMPEFAVKDKFQPNAKTTRAMIVYLLWEMQTGEYENVLKNMIEIATKEINIPTNPARYGSWIDPNTGKYVAWCALFASWCAKEVGLAAEKTNSSDVSAYPVKRTANCTDMANQFMANGNLYVADEFKKSLFGNANSFADSASFMPRVGDFVFFANGSKRMQHVGIVTKVEPLGNRKVKVSTIEGNPRVYTTSYEFSLDDTYGTITKGGSDNLKYILGFGRTFRTNLP